MDAERSRTHTHDSERPSKRPRRDASLCQRLPEHLEDKIVSRLPIRDIFRVRVVCRRWNSLVNCPSFGLLRAREGLPSEGPWFFALANPNGYHGVDRIAAYDPSVDKWHWIRHTNTTMLDNIDCMSSDAGLICYYDDVKKIAVVMDPLTRTVRRLPRGPMNVEVESVCLVVDQVTRSYRVFLIGKCKDETTVTKKRYNAVVEAYQSSSDSWYRMGKKSPPLSVRGMAYPTQVLHANGCLYVFDRTFFKLLAFNLDEHVWRRIKTPFLSCAYNGHAVQWQDRLLIITETGDLNDYGVRHCQLTGAICVWELHSATCRWVVVDRMPDCLYQELCHRDEGQLLRLAITSVAEGSLVLIVSRHNRDGSLAKSVMSFKTVLYDLKKKAWTMVEGCTNNGLKDWSFVDNIGYQPRLDGMV